MLSSNTQALEAHEFSGKAGATYCTLSPNEVTKTPPKSSFCPPIGNSTCALKVQVTLIITTKLLLIQSDLVSLKVQVTLIIDQTIDTIVTSSSPLAVSKAISAS